MSPHLADFLPLKAYDSHAVSLQLLATLVFSVSCCCLFFCCYWRLYCCCLRTLASLLLLHGVLAVVATLLQLQLFGHWRQHKKIYRKFTFFTFSIGKILVWILIRIKHKPGAQL
jgi:hypothetical protein